MKSLLPTALLCIVFSSSAEAVVMMPDPSGGLAKTPPMGWMSWEIYRCNVDCKEDPRNCIGAELYKTQADALVAEHGENNSSFLKAGYNTVHIDDCWATKHPPRNPKTGRLVPNATRFPQGFTGLADYVHSLGVKFGIYSDEGTKTCGGYPGSKGHELIDAQTFADWGVDYLKLDGCYNTAADYPQGYLAMGEALRAQSRPIEYSCSWPAYLGSDENTKPFPLMAAAGCNLWRNWDDIQCNWASLSSIIDHWGDYGPALQRAAAPGHWNDPDMLIIGNPCINDDEGETQMAMWSLLAAPLIMGNDARNISTARARATLMNPWAIAIDQDPLGKEGLRLTNSSHNATQVWARELSNGDVAVGLYNKLGGGTPWSPPPKPTGTCPNWTKTTDGYIEAAGGARGDVGTFFDLSVQAAKAKCCALPKCVGFSYNLASRSGYYKGNAEGGMIHNSAYTGYTLTNQIPPRKLLGKPANITVVFADLPGGFAPSDENVEVQVFDVWSGTTVGNFSRSYTAWDVAFHGTAFLRLSVVRNE